MRIATMPQARFQSRRQERGAAVFIVLMVVTLLTAVGFFAARAAAMLSRAAGFDRQSVQTRYVAEYGMHSTIAELGSGMATEYVNLMTNGTDECRATENVTPPVVGARIPCYKLQKNELDARVNTNFSGTSLFDLTDGGSLHALADHLDANFVVEMTDPGQATGSLVGTDRGGTDTSFRYVQIALTATGQVRPWTSTTSACTEASSVSSSLTTMRSHVVVGVTR